MVKTLEINEKFKTDCEKRIYDGGDKIKKRLDYLNKSNNIN